MNRPILGILESSPEVLKPFHREPVMPAGPMGGLSDSYSPRIQGPKYPLHDSNAPIVGGEDVAGLMAGAVITLGPLAAYALGFGL